MDKSLKDHIKQIKNDTEEYEELGEKLAIVKEEVFDMKVDILGSAFGMLMKKIHESIDDWLKIISEKEEQNKTLGDKIKESIEKALTEFSKQKAPEVKVNVDLKPLQTYFSEIKNQNQSIFGLIEKMERGNHSEEIYRLFAALVVKQNNFLEKSFEQIDITPQLNKISEGINKRPTEWEAWATEWSNSGGISKMKFKVTK